MVKGRRSAAKAFLALAEIGLIAAIVVVALGRRVPAVADLVAQIPGGGLAVIGAAVLLLAVAAVVMTVLVSD